MTSDLTAAVIQMNSTTDRQSNLATAEQMIEQAARDGAQLIALPELFGCLGPFPQILAAAESIPGPTTTWLSQIATRLKVMLCGGSLCEQAGVPGRFYNTSVLIQSDGELLARYRKVHLFQVDLAHGPQVDEAAFFSPGEKLSAVKTAQGNIGQAICYDLRFPELFRQLADREAELIVMPSAFTQVTGRAHWEILVRARAIENQLFLLAPNQVGAHGDGLESFGHSLIVDPWGTILAEADGRQEQVVLARLERQQLEDVRQSLPALKNRRLA